MSVAFTPEASAELRRLVSEFDEPNPGVAVVWLPAQYDLLRSPKGEAVWSEVQPERWGVQVMSLDVLPTEGNQLFELDGLRTLFAPGRSGVANVTIAFVDGHLQVQL
jgi:hypothetical protein